MVEDRRREQSYPRVHDGTSAGIIHRVSYDQGALAAVHGSGLPLEKQTTSPHRKKKRVLVNK